MPDMNVSLLESMSNSLDWLPVEPGYTQPDPYADMADQSVSQLSNTQRVVHTLHSPGRKYQWE